MRIITVEEHIVDPVIERATHAALAAEAGYLADLGASVDDKPPASANRPYVLPVRQIMPKATDVGAGRIADMDVKLLRFRGAVRGSVYEGSAMASSFAASDAMG